MPSRSGRDHCSANPLLPQFEEFMSLLAGIEQHEELFPKTCKTCGEQFKNLGEYLRKTKPKGHVFEDGSKVMKRPFTMIYRHCACGNTLILTLTSEILPDFQNFWSMMAGVARECDMPLTQVVGQFAEECDRFFALPDNSSL
jgi:hypothetical protein